jgi:hypothetical protein
MFLLGSLSRDTTDHGEFGFSSTVLCPTNLIPSTISPEQMNLLVSNNVDVDFFLARIVDTIVNRRHIQKH